VRVFGATAPFARRIEGGVGGMTWNLTPLPPSRRGKGERQTASSFPSPRRRGVRGEVPSRHIVVGQNVAAAKLQRAKELRREMTDAERLLWERLRRSQLGGFHFRRQQVIDGFIVDFYCHAAGLVLEVDGGVHARQAAYDEQRDLVLSRRGLRIVRIHNDEVLKKLDEVVVRIAQACGETGLSCAPDRACSDPRPGFRSPLAPARDRSRRAGPVGRAR